LVISLLSASANPCFADQHVFDRAVSRISVSGNETTRTPYILKWADLRPGEILTEKKFKEARQDILNKSLFKRVELDARPDGERVAVDINVEEKYYTLIVPRLSRTSDGDVKSGIKLYWHNIGGANQTLNMLVQQTALSNGDDDRKYRFDYEYPQFSRPYYFHWRLSQSELSTFEDGFRNTEYDDSFAFSVKRDLTTSLLENPLTLTTQLQAQHLRLDQPYPENFNEIKAGNFNSLGMEFSYDMVDQHYFRRVGRRFSVFYQQGFTELNSDYRSRILKLESIVFRPMNSLDNFYSRFVVGVSEVSPFNAPYFKLGGADNVRGIERDSFVGDAIVFANFEYVFGYHKYPSVRNSIFIDVGNVYEDAGSIDLNDIQGSIGTGIRWKVVAFIKTDLFIDVAYQPENSETFVYGGTSLSF
jgi:outer membrane protein assembly factor BamA